MTKYRGLRLDGKGWVEGYYGRDCLGGHVITVYSNNFESISHYDVNPESLSISFGLTDKHGKEIFGSIDGSKGGDKIEVTTGFIGDVKFKNGTFIIVNETGQFYYIGELISNLCYTIIGNQYETQ